MERIAKYTSAACISLSAAALGFTFLLVLFNVILRYVFRSGIAWSEEAARYAFVYTMFLGVIAVTIDKRHFCVDLLIPVLPWWVHRVKDLLVLLVLVLLVDGSWKMAVLTSNSTSPALGIPTFTLYLTLVFAGCVMLLVTTRAMYAELKRAITGRAE